MVAVPYLKFDKEEGLCYYLLTGLEKSVIIIACLGRRA